MTGDSAYDDIMDDYFDEHVDNPYRWGDPLFIDRDNLDMRLNPNSPVYNIPEWQEIPFTEIGINEVSSGVNFLDFAEFAGSWQSDYMSQNWNDKYDVIVDGKIDILDFLAWLETWLCY